MPKNHKIKIVLLLYVTAEACLHYFKQVFKVWVQFWGKKNLKIVSAFSYALDLIKEVLSLDDEIQKLATELYQQKSVLIMGRGYHYATCLEGALVSKHNPLFC